MAVTDTDRVARELTEPAPEIDFVRFERPDGSVFVDLTQLIDGSKMCCICYRYLPREALNELEPGVVKDVCTECAKVASPVSGGR